MYWNIRLTFRQHLLGQQFHLLTDNWQATCLTTNFKPFRRLTGILFDLAEFEFTAAHRPGRQDYVADMLSRYSCATVSQADILVAMQAEDDA